MTYAPEGSKLFGVTVKDWATSDYVFLLYKCTVRDFPCEVSTCRCLHFDFQLCIKLVANAFF